jgi:hypothetical protein
MHRGSLVEFYSPVFFIFEVDKHNDNNYFELILSLLYLEIFFSWSIKIYPILKNQSTEFCELRTAKGGSKRLEDWT